MDELIQAFVRSRADRLLERVEAEVCAQAARCLPADDHPSEAVDDEADVDHARVRLDIRDVAEPQPVRRGRTELALHEVCGTGGAVVGRVMVKGLRPLVAPRMPSCRMRRSNVQRAILIVLLTVYMWMLERRWLIPTRRTAFKIGAYWVVLTIVFEFGFGHYVDGKSWTELLHNYNIADGQAWVLVLVWMAVAPAVASRAPVRSPHHV